MKKLLVILIAVTVALSVAQKVNIQGTKNVAESFIYWDPGSTATDSTLKLLARDDTLWADSSGTLVDITGECSYPFFLTDSHVEFDGNTEYSSKSGGTHPGYSKLLSVMLESDRTDSNQIKFSIETRDEVLSERSYGTNMEWDWSAWTPAGYEKSGGGYTVLDTVKTDSTQTTDKIRQKLHFNVSGQQARLCPTLPTLFVDRLADSTWADSLIYYGR